MSELLTIVSTLELSELPELQRLVLGHTDQSTRAILAPMLALDVRCGGILTGASEPMLAQMRLAWWRDRLSEPAGARPKGDPLLDAIEMAWSGEEPALAALVDGWEALLAEGFLSSQSMSEFIEGRMASFAAAARLVDVRDCEDAARHAGLMFAAGDLYSRLSDPEEKELVRGYAIEAAQQPVRLPRPLRPLAILGSLGRRVLRRGEGPLFGDRLSPIILLRLGLLGR